MYICIYTGLIRTHIFQVEAVHRAVGRCAVAPLLDAADCGLVKRGIRQEGARLCEYWHGAQGDTRGAGSADESAQRDDLGHLRWGEEDEDIYVYIYTHIFMYTHMQIYIHIHTHTHIAVGHTWRGGGIQNDDHCYSICGVFSTRRAFYGEFLVPLRFVSAEHSILLPKGFFNIVSFFVYLYACTYVYVPAEQSTALPKGLIFYCLLS